jgi:hypothetical protein
MALPACINGTISVTEKRAALDGWATHVMAVVECRNSKGNLVKPARRFNPSMSNEALKDGSLSELVYEFATYMLGQHASVVRKCLTRSDSFEEYERLIGIASPHREFRERIAVEIARYIVGAWIESTPPYGDLKEKAKKSHHRLKILRNRLVRTAQPLVGNSEYDRAFVECVYDSHQLNTYKRPRGRTRKDFAKIFEDRVATIFLDVTGKPPTIINNRDRDNGGLYGALLKVLDRDTNRLATFMKLDRSRLSATLGRVARLRRKK